MKYTKKELQDLICDSCGKEYKSRYIKSRFCSSICRHDFWNNKTRVGQTVASDTVSRSTVGAIAELRVCCDLMSNGFSVYKSISPNCFSDIVAIKGESIYQIEVRTGRYFTNNKLIYPNGNLSGKSIVIYTFLDNKIHYLSNPELSTS